MKHFRASELTPKLGSEILDVKLLELQRAEIEELQRLAAERGVLVFRDQPMSIDEQVELGERFGELHQHPGLPENKYLTVHADGTSTGGGRRRVSGQKWHTDLSLTERPPALSMLRIEVTPAVGGDTAFASMYEAYDSLSSSMKTFLAGLTGIHSGEHSAAKYGDRDYPTSEHPLVRTHPVTGQRALYFNVNYMKRIKELEDRETEMVIRFLQDHVAYNVTAQVRIRWEPNTLVMWDNRCVQHHAIWDYFPEERHGYRVTTAGERPFLDRN